jgi:rare lipoprotein A
MYAKTAAHKYFPFNTIIEVTNQQNGKSVVVRINDRGPFKKGRILDLSYQAAMEIDMIREGIVEVKLKVLKLGKS